jgi:hypothetical protein
MRQKVSPREPLAIIKIWVILGRHPEPIIGAASVHGVLAGWRNQLQSGADDAVEAHAQQAGSAGAAEHPVAPTG